MTLRRALRKLRLKPGDILVVRDPQLLRRLGSAKFSLNIPIVYEERKGDLKVTSTAPPQNSSLALAHGSFHGLTIVQDEFLPQNYILTDPATYQRIKESAEAKR